MKLKSFGLAFVFLLWISSFAYSICNDPPPASQSNIGWAKAASGSRVIGYKIDNTSSWTTAELAEVRAAFSEWDSASDNTCMPMTFNEVMTGAVIVVKLDSGTTRTDINLQSYGTRVPIGATIFIDRNDFDNTNTTTYPNIIKKAMLHEIGHTMGMAHYAGTSGNSVMNAYNPPANSNGVKNDPNGFHPTTVQECDKARIALNPQCISPRSCSNNVQPNLNGSCNTGYVANANGYCCPAPTPTPPPVGGCGGAPFPNGSCASGFTNLGGVCHRSLAFQERCAEPTLYDESSCTCPDGTVGGSPILIDVDGGGFQLTSAADGVDFDLLAVGFTQHFSWTSAGSTNAFLVLDRNGNGTIDNGEELFGDSTPQPESTEPNGFLALAEYDKITLGGNDDGKINNQDVIFPMLQLWQDTNHNGISEVPELHSLQHFGVKTMDLRYKESRRTDEFGNRFLYRAKVRDAHGQQVGRWAWDVFFVMRP